MLWPHGNEHGSRAEAYVSPNEGYRGARRGHPRALLAAKTMLLIASGCTVQPAAAPTTAAPATVPSPVPTPPPLLMPTAPPSPVPAVPLAPPTTVPAPTQAPVAGTPASALGAQGKPVYDTYCQACHGKEGQGVVGPALWGPGANPAKYGPTAADWHRFIRQNMPQNNPGSLSPDEYLQVTTYLLLRNSLVQPTQPVSEPALGQITTEK